MDLRNVAHDIRLAARLLRRSPGFTAIAVLTLGLGIGASAIVFSVVNAYLIRPLPFGEPERLVSVLPAPSRDAFAHGIRPPEELETLDMRALDPVFETTAAWDLDGFTIASTDQPEYVDGAWVSPGFFQTLGIAPARGRSFTPDEAASGAPVAVISHALWQRRFAGDPAILGRAFTAYSTDRPNEAEVFTIIGVLPADFWYFNRFTDVLVPLRGPRFISLARLRTGVGIGHAERLLNAVGRAQFSGADPRWAMRLASARDEHVHQVRPTLVVLLAAVGFVVLVACANVAGLLVARGASRHREIALRAALGAGRGRVMAQLLAECVVLALLAAALGVVLASAGLRALAPTIAEQLPAAVPGGVGMLRLDGAGLAFTLGVATLTVMLFGLIPTVTASRVDLGRALARQGRGSIASPVRAPARAALVATQLAISLVLLAGAGSLIRTTMEFRAMRLGFEPDGVVKASILLPSAQYPEEHHRIAFHRSVLERLERTPGISSASAISSYPFRAMGGMPLTGDGARVDDALAARLAIAPRYLETMRIPLLRGRSFGDSDLSDSEPIALLSRALADRLWPGENPIGRRVKLGARDDDAPWRSVVGIVGDTRKSFTDSLVHDAYIPYTQSPRAYMFLVARSSEPGESAALRLQEAVWEVDRRQPISEAGSLADVVSRAMASHKFLATLLTGFSVFAVALATLGLYSVLAYLVTSRQREIAVRMACGAQPRDLVSMVLVQAVPVVALGIAAGIAGSLLLGRVLASLIAGIRTTDVGILATISLLLAATALLAILIPARRATRVDPMPVLRGE
ncbi:MAG TPA: ABC transporter permease [Gemmatimonadaceae bacterium]|nr:ABC transporter permease [Gemmatimonadaceae bacterium]